jgi:plastocyanin
MTRPVISRLIRLPWTGPRRERAVWAFAAIGVAALGLAAGAAPNKVSGRVPPARPRASGRIEGVATIGPRLTTSRARVRVYDEPGTPPAKPPLDESPFSNILLYLDAAAALRNAAPPDAAPTAAPALRQRDQRFVPHVLPVLAGTTVEFPNDDPIFHNVFSLSRAGTFDLGRYPKGSSRSRRFSSAGIVQVFCHIHADMSGYIVVLDNPFFVVPDAQGHFALDGVPPGDYRLVAWHERIRPIVTVVHVESGRTTALRIRVPLPDTAGVP